MKRFQLGVLAAMFYVAGCNSSVSAVAPQPSTAPGRIQHIVILVQENRSFDNLFAGYPGADTAMEGLCKPVEPWCKAEHEVPLLPVTLESTHRPGGKDICHSHACFKIECDRQPSGVCKNDGFDMVDLGEVQGGQPAKLYPYGYVERSESKPYWDLAHQYGLADRMFSTDTASSFIAHQQLIAGTVRLNDEESLTDQPDDGTAAWGCDAPPRTQVPVLLRDGREISPPHKGLPFPCFTEYQTLADLFDAANTTWTYYVATLYGIDADTSADTWNGFDAIKKVRYGSGWSHMRHPAAKIFSDLENGDLAQVSWVIPKLCESDHPGSGANRGPLWVTKVVNAIGASRYWNSTAIIVVWDDWGGWYDNVPPPQINYTSLGFRVPMIVISPYAKPGYLSHTEYNFGSILKFIEQSFNLGSLGATDASANSMTDMFDFMQRPTAFKRAALPSARSCPKNDEAQFVKENGAPPG
jgi:phospholipase C